MLDIRQELTHRGSGSVPLLMGVVNTTPDSFFDGGRALSAADARRRVDDLVAEGADIIDIGAESSKPGSPLVAADVQLARLLPALERALERGVWTSVDTTSAEVARVALAKGAHILNDVSGLRDERLAQLARDHDACLVITHCRAPMSQMTGFSEWPDDDYADIVEEVKVDWGRSRDRAMQLGLPRENLIFDPGFGYSKNARHCFELLARLSEFGSLDAPILSGPGRKSFIGSIDGSAPADRLGGTVAAALLSAQRGAHVVRVHDVRDVRQAFGVLARCALQHQPLQHQPLQHQPLQHQPLQHQPLQGQPLHRDTLQHDPPVRAER
jgi:dihydropteroate synthase